MNYVPLKCLCFFVFICIMPVVVQDLQCAGPVWAEQDRPAATMAPGKELSCSKGSTTTR